ncbi:MAG: hypothetical protein ACTSQU_14420 [Promethearchaeota archaeon]
MAITNSSISIRRFVPNMRENRILIGIPDNSQIILTMNAVLRESSHSFFLAYYRITYIPIINIIIDKTTTVIIAVITIASN